MKDRRRASSDNKLVLVTGISGTGVEASLSKFCQSHPEWAYVKLESYVQSLSRPLLEEALGRVWEHSEMPKLIQCFDLPEPSLLDVWVKAFKEAQDTTHPVTNRHGLREILESRNVLLTLHATWYHISWNSFLSPVNQALIARLKPKPSLVVTLIDDTYDVLVRLSRKGQLFDDAFVRPEKGEPEDFRRISYLLRILYWREFEVRQSEQLAKTLGVPHVTLAVKHPIGTFAKLLALPPESYTYLSHPISAVRRLSPGSRARKDLESFVEGVSAKLREEESTVLFEPTTIDEFRFTTNEDDWVEEYGLHARWSSAKSTAGTPLELLWDDSFGRAERQWIQQPFKDGYPLEGLHLLQGDIRRHLNWRDRKLVEQSSTVVAARPFASSKGKMSRGVKEELILNRELTALYGGDRRRRTSGRHQRTVPIAYHPRSDEGRRRIAALVRTCETYVERDLLKNWSDKARQRLMRGLTKMDLDRLAMLSPDAAAERIEDLMASPRDRESPSLVPKQTGGTMRGGRGPIQRANLLTEFGNDIRACIRGEVKVAVEFDTTDLVRSQAVMISDELATGLEVGDRIVQELRRIRL